MPADGVPVAEGPALPANLATSHPCRPVEGLESTIVTSSLSSMCAALAVLIAHALEKSGVLAPASNWLARDVGLFLGTVAMVVLVGVALRRWVLQPAADRRYRRQTQVLRAAREPVLRRWIGLAPHQELGDGDLWQWVQYRAVGMTDAIAEDWSAHGYHPGIAAAATAAGATRGQVYQLASAMVSAGAHDGLDRAALNDLIGWHFDIFDTPPWHPVLGRWLALPLPLVEQRAQALVDETNCTLAVEPARYPWQTPAGRVQGLLYTLEQEARAPSA